MAGNQLGEMFTVTSWGESHGAAIGCVVDGVPPRIALSVDDIQPWLDRRRPGQSRHASQRRETDAVEILSGVFAGQTTGTPIALQIRNHDARSKDYDEIAKRFRPGHADYTYWRKYGLRDPRGGGRASARETAVRVAAGAVARRVFASELGQALDIEGAMIAMGADHIDPLHWDSREIAANPFWCPDGAAARRWEEQLDQIRRDGSSVGAIIELRARGVPDGLGEPVFSRLDADIARAMMSINAVKGVEIGDGFAVAALRGEDNADEIEIDDNGAVRFLSNHAGGILGGISTGQDIVVRFAVKPTSSIRIPRRSIDENLQQVDVVTTGRHDPCVGIRAVPVGEAMLACVLVDHWLRHKAQCLQTVR